MVFLSQKNENLTMLILALRMYSYYFHSCTKQSVNPKIVYNVIYNELSS